MNNVIRTLDQLYLGNTMTQWWWSLSIFGATLVVTWLIKRVVQSYYRRMAATVEVELMETPLKVLSRTKNVFLLICSVFAGSQALTLTDRLQHIAEKVFLIAICWQVGLWASTAAITWLDLRRDDVNKHDRASAGSLNIIGIVLRIAIWAIVLLLTLDNLGINITTLVAGLGIGGIAVALAVQNVLGDLLASLSITLDKPFVLGDFLIIDDFMGAVEYIGIKSVRLRSLSGEQIIMSNADLLKSRVRNYGRMKERRVLFSVGVTYETPREKLMILTDLVRNVVMNQSGVRLDRCHLARLSSYSIDVEVVYFVLSAEYNTYMDIQQNINLQLIEVFARENIEFAYPTQKQWTAMTSVQSLGAIS
jgi:small-conductance mechanosensitive channel